MRDGRKLTRFVEQSLGNVHRPLSNAELEEKFLDQAVLALPRASVEKLIERCAGTSMSSVTPADLARATVPSGDRSAVRSAAAAQ